MLFNRKKKVFATLCLFYRMANTSRYKTMHCLQHKPPAELILQNKYISGTFKTSNLLF